MKKYRANNGKTMNLTDKLAHALVKMGKGTIVEPEAMEIKAVKEINHQNQAKKNKTKPSV